MSHGVAHIFLSTTIFSSTMSNKFFHRCSVTLNRVFNLINTSSHHTVIHVLVHHRFMGKDYLYLLYFARSNICNNVTIII